MSRSGRVSLFFFEGDFDFRLGIGELVALEEVRLARLKQQFAAVGPAEASVGALHARLAAGLAMIDDIRHTLRLALIGGGMAREPAHDLVARHLIEGQLLECAKVAQAALAVALVGAPEDPAGGDGAGEATGATAPTAAPPTASPAGRKSTASAARSAGTPAPSTGSASGN